MNFGNFQDNSFQIDLVNSNDNVTCSFRSAVLNHCGIQCDDVPETIQVTLDDFINLFSQEQSKQKLYELCKDIFGMANLDYPSFISNTQFYEYFVDYINMFNHLFQHEYVSFAMPYFHYSVLEFFAKNNPNLELELRIVNDNQDDVFVDIADGQVQLEQI